MNIAFFLRPGRWIPFGALAFTVVFGGFVACEDAVEPSDLAGKAVWSASERAEYVLLDGDDEVGRATFAVERDGDAWVLRQEYTARKVTDKVAIRVGEPGLKPRSLTRSLDGEDGRIQLDVEYKDGRAIVRADNGEERRSNSSDVPAFAYDSWEGLFLWRTLPLAEGYAAAYRSMVTAVPRKPEDGAKTVRVKKRERVRVPAGEFDTWRVKVTGDGVSETAWIAVDAPHPVVKYDNGSAVFELTKYQP